MYIIIDTSNKTQSLFRYFISSQICICLTFFYVFCILVAKNLNNRTYRSTRGCKEPTT